MRRETWPPWLFIATSHMYVWANWRETSIYWVSISLKNIFSLALVGVVFNYHSITASTSPLVLSHLCILLWYLSCHSLLEPSRAVIYRFNISIAQSRTKHDWKTCFVGSVMSAEAWAFVLQVLGF
jgi:hypothetical protein